MRKIKAIHGLEPARSDEYQMCYQVGYSGVTKIEFADKNLGTYGISQLDIYKGDFVCATVMHQALSKIVYFEPGETK